MAKAPADIRSMARSHTATAIKTLVGIMTCTEATPAARLAAANSILDRGWGKVQMAGDGDSAPAQVTITWQNTAS